MKKKSILLLIFDFIIINISAFLTLEIRFDFQVEHVYKMSLLDNLWIYIIISLVNFYIWDMYRIIWRHAGVEEMVKVFASSLFSMGSFYVVVSISGIKMFRSFYIINFMLLMMFAGGSRFLYRFYENQKLKSSQQPITASENVIIIGAGSAGTMVVKEMLSNQQLGKNPVAIIDDDSGKIGKTIKGIPIIGGRYSIGEAIIAYAVKEIILAIPSADNKIKRDIVDIVKKYNCRIKTIPGVYELIDGKIDLKRIRDVKIEDLLGRNPVKLNLSEVESYISEKNVLVTGGGGSIGSELCRQIMNYNPKKLIILDISENSVYEIQQELKRKKYLNIEVLIGSIRDKKRLEELFEEYKPEIVFHAAAHKHVPLMEDSPKEAVKNNIFGTWNLAEISGKYQVERFVLISTDKAVNPTNIMGATKRTAELIIQQMNVMYENTDYVAVRFGNVLGSNGSVIPLFKKQIEEGGPVTVTHPDIIRYFMTIPEAVQLVLQAGSLANGGEIFVLNMGEPVKIVSLAEDLISLSGFEPYKEIEIVFTGLRPGEKLYEELLMAEEGLEETKYEKIYVAEPFQAKKELFEKLTELKNAIDKMSEGELYSNIKDITKTFNYQK